MHGFHQIYFLYCLRSMYFNAVILHAAPALRHLSDGIAMNGLLDAIRKKPMIYEAIVTKKMDSLFTWSYEDFLDELKADYSKKGSMKHAAEIDCHKAFMDVMEEVCNDGK